MNRGWVVNRVWGLAALALAGCGNTVELSDVPPDVAFVALARFDRERIVEATPLRRADQAVSFFGPSDADLAVVGYGAAPIEGWLSQWYDGALPTAALGPAQGCAAKMPRPVWYARNDGGAEFMRRAPEDAPDLAAPWLQDRCPDLVEDQVSVNLACDPNPCVVARAKTGPCTFVVDVSGCAQPPIEVVVQPDGTACVPADEGQALGNRTCAPTEIAPLPTAYSGLCSGENELGERFSECLTEVYVTPERPLTQRNEVRLTELPIDYPDWVDGTFAIMTGDDLRRGPLLDIAAQQTRVAVLGLPEDATSPAAACFGRRQRPRVLYLLDPSTLDPTRTATVPPCAAHLVADPAQSGFVFVYPAPGAQWTLARVDLNGRRVAEQPLPVPDHRTIIDLHPATDGSGRLIALATTLDDRVSSVIVLDGRTFAVRGMADVPGRFLSVSTLASGDLLLGSSREGDLQFLRGGVSGFTRVRFAFATEGRADLRIIDLAGATGLMGDSVAVAVSGNRPALVAWQGTVTVPAGPLDVNFQPGPVVSWPASPGRVLVGGLTTEDPPRGILQVFDVAARRFVPGAVYVGQSAITSLTVHPDGDVLGLLGWSSRVVRWTATP